MCFLRMVILLSFIGHNFTLWPQIDFNAKAWNHLKLQPFLTPENIFPDITSSHLSQWNVTWDCSLSLTDRDFDIYFKTIAMGQRKLSLGLGWILEHHRAHVLSVVKVKYCFSEMYINFGSRLVLSAVFSLIFWHFLSEVNIETQHLKRGCNVLQVKAERAVSGTCEWIDSSSQNTYIKSCE